MSRHARIADQLDRTQKLGLIESWVRDSDPGDRNGRVRWIVQANKLEQLNMDTNEAEAFLKGVGVAVNK